ncbi:hypothetical protein SBRY_10665 [Actinacidiphila bryophytorum]|uniref:Uncharacterized protein n=1 Tax=Actinacidiphila bryophytorum TaxID=1436133 RepID=A0A9W4GXD3_9ACTN|nr:hypothetical protein SBRY_10665 [Actinacidiphila bryophytorum]
MAITWGRGELRAQSRRTGRCELTARGNRPGARGTARQATAVLRPIAHRKGQIPQGRGAPRVRRYGTRT